MNYPHEDSSSAETLHLDHRVRIFKGLSALRGSEDSIRLGQPASFAANESALPLAEEAIYCRATPRRRTL